MTRWLDSIVFWSDAGHGQKVDIQQSLMDWTSIVIQRFLLRLLNLDHGRLSKVTDNRNERDNIALSKKLR